MPVSELEKNPDMRISAARTAKRIPSGASFKTGVNPGDDREAMLKKNRGRHKPRVQTDQGRCNTSSSTSFDPKNASISTRKPARVKRTAVWLRQPS